MNFFVIKSGMFHVIPVAEHITNTVYIACKVKDENDSSYAMIIAYDILDDRVINIDIEQLELAKVRYKYDNSGPFSKNGVDRMINKIEQFLHVTKLVYGDERNF